MFSSVAFTSTFVVAVFRQRRLLAYPPTISHCPYSKIIVSGRFKWHANTYKSSQLTNVSLRMRGSVRSRRSNRCRLIAGMQFSTWHLRADWCPLPKVIKFIIWGICVQYQICLYVYNVYIPNLSMTGPDSPRCFFFLLVLHFDFYWQVFKRAEIIVISAASRAFYKSAELKSILLFKISLINNSYR